MKPVLTTPSVSTTMKPASKTQPAKKAQMFAQIKILLDWAAKDLGRPKWKDLMESEPLKDFLSAAYNYRPKAYRELTKESNLKSEEELWPDRRKKDNQAGSRVRSAKNDHTARAAQKLDAWVSRSKSEGQQNGRNKARSENGQAQTKEERDAQFEWEVVNEMDSALKHMVKMVTYVEGLSLPLDKCEAVFRYFSILDMEQIKADMRSYFKSRAAQSGQNSHIFAVDLQNPIALIRGIDFTWSEKIYYSVRRAWILTKLFYQVEQRVNLNKRMFKTPPGNATHAWLACRELAEANIGGKEVFSELPGQQQQDLTRAIHKKYQWGDRMVQLSASFEGDGIFLVFAVARASFSMVEQKFTGPQIQILHWLAKRMRSVIKLAQECTPYIEDFVTKGFLTQEQQNQLVPEERVDYSDMFPKDDMGEDDEMDRWDSDLEDEIGEQFQCEIHAEEDVDDKDEEEDSDSRMIGNGEGDNDKNDG